MIIDFGKAIALGLKLWPILNGFIQAAKEDSDGGKKITADELADLIGGVAPIIVDELGKSGVQVSGELMQAPDPRVSRRAPRS